MRENLPGFVLSWVPLPRGFALALLPTCSNACIFFRESNQYSALGLIQDKMTFLASQDESLV